MNYATDKAVKENDIFKTEGNKGREKNVLTCETIIRILKTKLEEINQEE